MGVTRRWSCARPRGSMVDHPAVLKLVERGDPGTRPRRVHIGGTVLVTYSSTRVNMKRDAWEMMDEGDLFVQWIRPKGQQPWAIALTRRELERTFGEITESESWDDPKVRCYHFPLLPPAATAYRVPTLGPAHY
jgi:hypothetical protein